MKITKIKIRNLFGISEKTLDGKSVELSGNNGLGKTSVIDSIKYALTNDSNKDYVIKNGESEGEILIETDTGFSIDRKKRSGQSDYKSIKENGKDVPSPENVIRGLFTPLQLDPVKFTQMTKKEQNRAILDLIEFDWDLNWIKEKFGEIPQGINYEQNILQVLNDIQAENSPYFQSRQNVNRDKRNKEAFISDIAEDIPEHFDADKWEAFDLSSAYKKINSAKEINSRIQRAKTFKESYNGKVRGYEADKEISISAEKDAIANEKESLLKDNERMKAQIKANEDKISGLLGRLSDRIKIAESEYKEKIAKLDGEVKVADEYIDKTPADTSEMEEEVTVAEEMKKHLNEYRRMVDMQAEVEKLTDIAESLTNKIELARSLPGEILQTANIPVKGLTVKDGIPLIDLGNGPLPISNLSEGQQLLLCVDVAISKPNNLQIILIDGAEKLSTENREKLYAKCKEKGLQFIATRTSDANEIEVAYL